MTEIARTGQAAPGIADQNFQQFEWLYLNNSGQVAFTAITCCSAGVFRWDAKSGTLTNLILKNQVAPDGNGVIDFLPSSIVSPVDLNDAGQIVFASQVVGGSLFGDFGIFLYDDRLGLLQVARYGDALLGSTITKLGLATGSSRANVPGGTAGRELSPLNNRGQVAYSFGLADGRTGVAIWTPAELRITDIEIASNDVRIFWNATSGQTNIVQASASIGGGFTNVSGNIPIVGSGQVSTNFVETDGAIKGSSRFYRVHVTP